MHRFTRTTLWILGASLAAATALVLWQGNAARKVAPEPDAEQRTRIPNLAFVDLDGNAGNLNDYRGKIVVVNFWASWCPPCRKEMPDLVRISKKYASNGVVVLGVAMDVGGLDGVRRFLQEFDVTYPVVTPQGDPSELSSVRGLPTTWLIDKKGRIAVIYAGAMKEDVFRQGIDRLLAEPPGTAEPPNQTETRRNFDSTRSASTGGEPGEYALE